MPDVPSIVPTCHQCGESLVAPGSEASADGSLPATCPHCGSTVELPADPSTIPPPRELNPELLNMQLITPRAPLAPGDMVGMGSYAPLPRPSPPQWAPDPSGRNQWRWWNGGRWTDDVANDGEPASDPL
jgi:hypothetical protein